MDVFQRISQGRRKKNSEYNMFLEIFKLTFDLTFNDTEIFKYFFIISQHRRAMSSKLNREIGVEVAILDYFSTVEKFIENPVIIDNKIFQKMKKSLNLDMKTNVYNYDHFISLLRKEIQNAKQYSTKFSLLFLDIDDFKLINDTYGHIIGDKCLIHLSSILKCTLNEESIIARFGGDEFIVLLPNNDKDSSYTISQHILHNFRNNPLKFKSNHHNNTMKCRLSASIGISSFPEDGGSVEELLLKSDTCLLKAKELGKNKVICFQRNTL